MFIFILGINTAAMLCCEGQALATPRATGQG